jgi:hypothetical protein
VAGRNWLTNIPRGGRQRGVRVVTNNPERGSNNFGGFKPVGYAKRTIRRLVKRDPNNAQGLSDGLLQTPGMEGNGASRGVTVMGHTERRRVTTGSANSGGPRRIVDRSKASNIRGLKKR